MLALAASLVIAASATAATASRAADATSPHVTLIGDSVLTAVIWNDDPIQIMGKGLDLDLEVAVCRRLVGVSCPFEGARPSTLVDVVHELGPRLGTVVVVAGYNEPEAEFVDALEQSLAALRGAGVARVLWASLSERRADFTRMNVMLAAAARRHPELTIVDWARASRDHNDWFQTDGIHLTYAGAVGMARLLRDAVDRALTAPESGSLAATAFAVAAPAAALPKARVGVWYDVPVVARGGTLPYRWATTSGPLPKGLHLTSAGRIWGVPRRPVTTRVTFRVEDASGRVAVGATRLVIGR